MEVIDSVDVIVVGAGVAGLSTAMQLGRRGQRVVVLERAQIGGGSTGRAAGLLGQLRGTAASTKMLMDGLEIVRELERETGTEIFVETGSVRVAETAEREQEVRDLVAMGRSVGLPIELLDEAGLRRLLPHMRTDDIRASCLCPSDGHVQPAELAAAYVEVGRRNGVRCRTACPVTAILTRGGRVTGVRTPHGEHHAPVVVNAGGPWSWLVAELGASSLPTAALGHYYITTRPLDGVTVDRRSPAVRDRHHRIYARPEGGGLIVGMYEADPVPYDMAALPAQFDMSAMKVARDDENLARLIDAAHQRFPWIDERTPMTVTTGIMTFTPDGKPLCGRLAALEGLFHCTGFSGHGIVQSPAIGVIMAELILDGTSKYDIREIEADRFFDLPGFQTRAEIEERCYNMYASYYGRVEGRATPFS